MKVTVRKASDWFTGQRKSHLDLHQGDLIKMDPETRALWNAVVSGKITRDGDRVAIRIATLKEAIVEMRMSVQVGTDALRDAETLLAKLEAG